MESILIVDDEPGVRHFLKKIFCREYEIATAADGEKALAFVGNTIPDLILLDFRLPGINGLDTLEQIQSIEPNLPVVLITAHGDTDTAIQAIARGAFDYLTKPLDIDILRHAIQRGLKASRPNHSADIEMVSTDKQFVEERLIGNSTSMVEICKIIGQVAPSDVTVLIKGESGTGKELIAWTLHRYSARTEHPFVAINCAAIPENLLESELFGYEKGAFTGADSEGKRGKFELAEGGTLFLDEIGDMSLATQAKVLRVLQDGSFQRVGGTQTLQPDVRILAATNKNLENRIKDGQFRRDLFHRLAVITIEAPPLRDHLEDIQDLLEYFIQRFNAEFQLNIQAFERGLVESFQHYNWPGNIRELENLIKKAMVMCKGEYLSMEQFSDEIPTDSHEEENPLNGYSFIMEKALQQCIGSTKKPFEAIIGSVERVLVKAALDNSNWNQVQASRILGVTRTTLRKKMKNFQLH